MSNIISAQNYNSENPVYARKISQDSVSRYSEAPESLPKYSIHKTLQEKDEFRRTVSLMHKNNQKAQKRKCVMGKVLAVAAAIGAFAILEAKKII